MLDVIYLITRITQQKYRNKSTNMNARNVLLSSYRYQYSRYKDDMTLYVGYNFILDCSGWNSGSNQKFEHSCCQYFLGLPFIIKHCYT